MRVRTVFLLLAVCLILPVGMGKSACDKPEPQTVMDSISYGLTSAEAIIPLIEAGATINNEPEFSPCMAATGSLAGIDIAQAALPAIEAEATNPDGAIHIDGGPIDFSRCMGMAGQPDPWPPVEPNPEIEAAITNMVPLFCDAADALVRPKVPASGDECIRGRVALAVMASVCDLVTTTAVDAANGAEVTSIPEFDVEYSGCGLSFGPTKDAEPAPIDLP